MAISVAPLTTVVMGSVEQDHAGTASGINNAVARLAGVLAIAVLGFVMVGAFKHSLLNSLVALNLPPGVTGYIRWNSTKLAGLDLPAGLDPGIGLAIRAQIARSFVFGFRLVMLICSCLAVASSAGSVLMIPAANPQVANTPRPAEA